MKTLIISPHTDDAELGAGATIRKFNSKDLFWITFSACSESIPEGFDSDSTRKEFTKVRELYGIEGQLYNFPVRRFNDYRQDILDVLIQNKQYFNPGLVIGPSLNDVHQDHRVVAEEMIRAFKNSSILSYELPWNDLSSGNNYFSTLTKPLLDFKLEVLGCYKSQIAKNKFYSRPDFVTSLATVRGAQINVKYAEAFEVIRWIN